MGLMVHIYLPICLRCLKVCPGCEQISEVKRQNQAEAAIRFLREKFPELGLGREPEKDQS
jgi:hypothetical protein